MIDILVKLIEKFIEFLKLRKEQEKRAFDLLVIPTFNDMKTVHEDYLQLFHDCHRNLKARTKITVIAKRLTEERLEREALRRSLRAFADTFASDPRLKTYSDFFRAVSDYLLSEDNNRSYMLLEGMQRSEPRDRLAAITDEFLTDIGEAWKKIAKEYAKITAQSITT